MSDILKFLRSYPNDPAAVMSQTRVAEAIAEIERLRAELAAERERADAHYRALENVTAKRDELRANLRDELERADAWHKTFLQTQKHNEELRGLLREARAFCPGDYYANDRLRARIDAALKGDGDE